MQAPQPSGTLNKVKAVLAPPKWSELFGRASLSTGNRLGNNGQSHSVKREIWAMMVLATFGLVLGLCVNALFGLLVLKLKSRWNKFFWAIFQLFTILVMTFAMYNFLPETLTGTFQGTYPGMMFPVFFYGTQTNMFDGFKAPFGPIMG